MLACFFALAWPAAVLRTVHLTPRAGITLTFQYGSARLTVYDAMAWGVMHKPGVTAEPANYRVRILPRVDVSEGKVQTELPLWIPAAACGAVAWWTRRKRWHLRSWQCVCGYDVRGNLAGRCPECGRAIG